MWYTFAATSCQMTMVKNEIFQAQKGQCEGSKSQYVEGDLTLFLPGSGKYVIGRGGPLWPGLIYVVIDSPKGLLPP